MLESLYGNWLVLMNATIQILIILNGIVNEELINSYGKVLWNIY